MTWMFFLKEGLEISPPPKVMLCFLSIRNAMAMVDLDDWCQQTWPNNPRAFFDVLFHIRANDWLEIPMIFLKKGDSVIRTPEVENFASLQFFQAMNIQWSFWKAFRPWVFSAYLQGQTSHSFGAKHVKLPVYWFEWSTSKQKDYCGFTTVNIFLQCSTYKNIQVNIWLLGSWHWSCKKNIDIFRYSSKKVGSFGWILDFKSSVTTVCYPWLAVRLRMGMAFSPKKNYNLWLGCWIFGVSISINYCIFLLFSGWWKLPNILSNFHPENLEDEPILTNTFKGKLKPPTRFAEMGWGMEGGDEHHITKFMTWWLKLY